MSETGKKAAWRSFCAPIERVVGCVDQSARLDARLFDNGRRHLAGVKIPFGADLLLTFAFTLEHGIKAGVDRMTTRSYSFTLTPRSDPTKRVFAWHWHPASTRSRVAYPHVHLPPGTPYASYHVPTGRVSLEEVILFGFTDLDVEPAVADGQRIVEDAMSTHKQYRAWS